MASIKCTINGKYLVEATTEKEKTSFGLLLKSIESGKKSNQEVEDFCKENKITYKAL